MKTPLRIALIGFMGSGKSTVGALLARRVGYKFIDLDSVIEEKAGLKIKDIFATQGEPAFRRLETECLLAMAERSGIVLSAGGGAPASEENRAFFRDSAVTFFLRTSLETALSRAGADGSRPLLEKSPEETRRLFESRGDIYAALGRTVDSEGKSPLEIVESIVDLLDSTRETRESGGSD